MVKPGTNQVDGMPRDLRKSRMRREASVPNSPRESGVGVVMPRAMKPEWVSKSRLKQTIWRGTAFLVDRTGCRASITSRMATKTIGIILHGATGRICSTQHLKNALVPIRDEGGLAVGADRIVPRLLLVGRDRERVAEVAR